MKILRWLERTFLLIGLAAIGVWIGSIAVTTIWQGWQNRQFDRRIRSQPRMAKANSPQRAPERPATAAAKARDAGLVGRLSIPRLKLSAMIREGTGDDILGVAIGHIPGTALPGQMGNIAVAGHRDTLFRGLRDVRKNDLIRLETVGGDYFYKVASTEIVKPGDVSVLRADLSPELTLVTCYPFNYIGAAPERFIVKAWQVSGGPVQDSKPVSEGVVRAASFEEPARRSPAVRKVPFSVTKNHSRQLAPGISLGLTGTNTAGHLVDGWMWLMPDRRTIWLRSHDASEPIIFYDGQDGRKHELQITAVTKDSVTGYLVLPPAE